MGGEYQKAVEGEQAKAEQKVNETMFNAMRTELHELSAFRKEAKSKLNIMKRSIVQTNGVVHAVAELPIAIGEEGGGWISDLFEITAKRLGNIGGRVVTAYGTGCFRAEVYFTPELEDRVNDALMKGVPAEIIAKKNNFNVNVFYRAKPALRPSMA